MLLLGIDIGGSSIKSAVLRDGQDVWRGRSAPYVRPTLAQLVRAVGEAVAGAPGPVDRVGLCLPGLLDERRERVTLSVNLPCLNNAPIGRLLPASLAPARGGGPMIATDAHAAAHDLYIARGLSGRLLAIVLGTGVGAAVLDGALAPLRVDGDSPGHLGQVDVSLDRPGEAPVIGPDGGVGSLEGYIGADALDRRYGAGQCCQRMGADDPPALALARAIRIAHAIYRPSHVCLAGGIGARLGRLIEPMRQRIDAGLTRLARPGWTLTCADHDFHAALGAARLAGS